MSVSQVQPSFFSSTATLLCGNLSARILTFLLIPIVTRLFDPSAFGVFAAFDSLLILLGAFCHLRYPMAVFVARKRGDVNALVLLSLLVSLGVSLLIFLLLLPFQDALAEQFGIPGQGDIFFLLAPSLFVGAVSFILLQLATRDNHFLGMAGARMLSTAAERGSTIGLGAAGLGTAGSLVLGRILGLAASILGLFFSVRRSALHALFRKGSWLRLGKVARTYRDFALYSPSVLLHQGAVGLPPLVLTMYFLPAEVGLYALCRSALREPINILGEALARALYAKISGMNRRGEDIAAFMAKFTAYSMDLIIPPLAVVAVVAGPLFGFVFGAQWQDAAPYVVLLSTFWALSFVSRPISCLFDVLALLRERVVFDGFFFAASMGGLFLGATLGSPLLAVGLFSLSGSLFLLWRIIWLLGKAGVSKFTFFRFTVHRILRALPVFIVVLVCRPLLDGPVLLFTMAAGLTLHYVILLFLDPSLKQHMRAVLNRSK